MAHETVNSRRKNYGFKSLAIYKVIHLLLITKLHNNTIALMYKIQKNFIWQGKKAKMKNSTLCNRCEKGGSKNVDLGNNTSIFNR